MTIPRRWCAFPVPSAFFPRCPHFLRVFRVLALSPSAPRRVRVDPRPQRNATQHVRNALRARTTRVADYLLTSSRVALLTAQADASTQRVQEVAEHLDAQVSRVVGEVSQ